MIDEDLWNPKQEHQEKHRAWRQRKACFGEMEQFDGSYHHWFENRGPYCCLLAAIDDATGNPPKLNLLIMKVYSLFFNSGQNT